MKFKISIGTLAFLAIVLLVAASAPETTYSVLTSPQRWIEHQEMEMQREASLAEWAQVVSDAESGNPAAMYKLGRKKQFWSNEEWTGVKRDAVEAERLIRSAAEKHNIDAMLWVWLVDERPIDYVDEMASVILNSDETTNEHVAKFSAFLYGVGAEKCDKEVLNKSREVLRALEDTDFDLATFKSRHAHLEESFSSGHCAIAD